MKTHPLTRLLAEPHPIEQLVERMEEYLDEGKHKPGVYIKSDLFVVTTLLPEFVERLACQEEGVIGLRSFFCASLRLYVVCHNYHELISRFAFHRRYIKDYPAYHPELWFQILDALSILERELPGLQEITNEAIDSLICNESLSERDLIGLLEFIEAARLTMIADGEDRWFLLSWLLDVEETITDMAEE